ncbi:MAG: NADH-quinone oxidoreductase subunit NuoH, partial [Planctomycetota bacterium]
QVVEWIKHSLLADQFAFSVLLMIVLLGAIMGAVAYSILLERKISAWIQDRHGPNRAGPRGLLQPIADGLKFFLKEDIIPRNVDRILFLFAPWLIFAVALLGYAVIPWGGTFRWPWMDADAEPLRAQVASIDIGLLYILAFGSMGVYGVVLGGWASNNKYSFFGGMRSAAQMLSYEVPMGLAILVVVMTTGNLRLEGIVLAQNGSLGSIPGANWTILYHPLAAFLVFVAMLAESNRMPFDLGESEQELVGGYHTEYSALKLALFFLAEYAHMITAGAFLVALFFGGYLVPGWRWLNEDTSWLAMIARMVVFAAKVFLVIAFVMIVRWTLPRFRYDQVMRLAWKSLVPMGLAIVAAQAIIMFAGWSQWVSLFASVLIVVLAAVIGAAGGTPVTGRQQSLMKQ